MRAIVWTRYGPPEVLQLKEVEKPIPKDNEVLVKVHASTVTAGDCELRELKIPISFRIPMQIYVGWRKPERITVLGQELAGEIEETGKEVTRFRAGDPVFAWTGLRLGGYAEYTCVPENADMAIKPANITFEEAAALSVGGLEASDFLRRANIQSGEKVLINGAGGSIGTFAIQIAKYFGAEVTAVDSTGKLDMLRSIGADHVIDYTSEDFTKSGRTYDVIFDVIGKSSFSGSLRSLKQNGRYLLGNPGISERARGQWTAMRNGQKLIFRSEGQGARNLAFLTELVEAGQIRTIIDRLYPLEQIADAHRYVDSGQKKGNVIITV